MKFLDEIGLASFWEKIKNWVNINYLSLKGGTINGNINISGNVSALQFKKTNGTSTQVLIADGSVKGIGSANGIAGLDANGYVPLAQLGNLDTTVAEVVTALPTTNIKKHIYLIRDTSGVTQNNQYEEYIYTGDTSATYDASKWEKLGDFRATVDLANYAKKSEIPTKVSQLSNDKGYLTSHQSLADYAKKSEIPTKVSQLSNDKGYLTSHQSLADYAKKSETVDISTIKVEEKVLDVTPQGQKLQQVIYFLNFNGTIKEVVIKDATSAMSGFMSIRDKNRLDGIASGATADSAIPISVIDALN